MPTTTYVAVEHPNGCFMGIEKLAEPASESEIQEHLADFGITGQVTEEMLRRAFYVQGLPALTVAANVLGWIEGGMEAVNAFLEEWAPRFLEKETAGDMYATMWHDGALTEAEKNALQKEVEDQCEREDRLLLVRVWPGNTKEVR